MKPATDAKQIDQFLTRGVEKIFPATDFLRARMLEGKALTLYYGIDPTGPALHVGHAIELNKLRVWQNLGHKVILLIGDFTGMIGDPTDKGAARKRLTREEVLANAKTYKEQASKILRFDGENPAAIRFNSEWLAKMNFADVVELASHFTVQQMLARDMFQKRFYGEIRCPHCNTYLIAKAGVWTSPSLSDELEGSGAWSLPEKLVCSVCKKEFETKFRDINSPKPIYLHEFFYPLMQAYDSVALDTDGEIGGNDQTFNMLAGRDLMKDLKGKEKFVIAMKLLADPTGKKMGKSEGNMITLGDAAEDMYGKVMSWPDGMILGGFEILTDVPTDELRKISKGLSSDTLNPRDAKDRLAREIVAAFHGQVAADAAAENFVKLFREKEVPDEMIEYKISGKEKIIDILVKSGLVASKSEARRQMEQGGIKVGGTVVTDINTETTSGVVIQKGKRFFVRVV